MNLPRLALLVLLVPATASADDTFEVSVGERQLFLDDHGIAKIDGLQRTMHQPKKRGAVIEPDQPWESALQTRCAPAWDEQAKLYKLWMITSVRKGSEPDSDFGGVTYAESTDGVHWTKPIQRQRKYQGSRENNFLEFETNSMENALYHAEDPDPNQRFKGLLGALGRRPAASPDGIHWRRLDVPEIPSGDESNLSYDRANGTFIATLKSNGPYGRAHGVWTSKDFKIWTNSNVTIHADKRDQELATENIRTRLSDAMLQQPVYDNPNDYNADIYNVGIFRYEGIYVGLPAVFHATGKIPAGNQDGFHLIQLMCSRDLKTWQRLGERKPFIGPSPVGKGAYDLTQLLPPSAPVVRGDELWFYYTGIKYRVPPAKPDLGVGAVCLAVLRRDGFVSLDAGEAFGTITTKPFKWSGSKLMANVETKEHGELRAEVLDTAGKVIATSQPVKDNEPRGEFRWSQALSESLQGQLVSLRFALREASFYAWWAE